MDVVSTLANIADLPGMDEIGVDLSLSATWSESLLRQTDSFAIAILFSVKSCWSCEEYQCLSSFVPLLFLERPVLIEGAFSIRRRNWPIGVHNYCLHTEKLVSVSRTQQTSPLQRMQLQRNLDSYTFLCI